MRKQPIDLQQALVIFTDGACSGNPGPGGWGAILAYPEGKITELGDKNSATTNNQMELTSVIVALEEARDFNGAVAIFTDSTYVIRGITQWIWGWQKRGWKTAEGKDVANAELWKKLLRIVNLRSLQPQWHYVRGHQGNPGNERADEIAVAFSKGYSIKLYRGCLLQYSLAIYDFPEDTSLPEMRAQTEKKVAHSYLSIVAGNPQRHTDWKSCEARVKGQSGAKFKKTSSKENEAEVLTQWGYRLEDL